MIGIGYRAYCMFRKKHEGICDADLEHNGINRPVIYLGRLTLRDSATGITAQGDVKVGMSTKANVVMRARNQPGGDFRLLCEMLIDGDLGTAEKTAHDALIDSWVADPNGHGQRELFRIPDDELRVQVDNIRKAIDSTMGYSKARVKELVWFDDDTYLVTA